MLNEAEVIEEVIAELLASIQAACRDYFLWTRGRVLYDHGVEALLHVFAGRQLFERFAPQYQATVRLEHSLREILPNTPGRADLTLTFPDGPIIVIEFKRYFNDAAIRSDLARLRRVSAVQRHVGILAGPCFIRENSVDWVEQLTDDMKAKSPDFSPQTSAVGQLPVAFREAGSWNRSRAIAVRVGG